jgi:hypothetical protein
MAATTPLSVVVSSLVQAAHLGSPSRAPTRLTLVAAVVVHERGVAGKLQQPARSFANGAESMRHLEA